MNPAGEQWARPRARAPLWIIAGAAATIALTACASGPDPGPFDAAAPAILATIRTAGVYDHRGSYRAALCRRLSDNGGPCDDVLRRLPDEDEPKSAAPAPDAALRYRMAFVPGFFADCAGPIVRPFVSVERDLMQAGVDVHHLAVAGRGTSAANAERIAQKLAALPEDPRPLIVFAYSKGLTDVLEFVLRHPEKANRIAAIVSIAGAAQGSLLADELQGEYRALLSSSRLLTCEPGTGEEIDDVRREVRLEWWRRHRTAIPMPVFFVVTMPRPERVTPFTATTYRMLAAIDPLNDGLLFWYDQIVPGGHLLGFVNADHVTVVQSAWPRWPSQIAHDVPRTRLIEAAIEVIDNTLRGIATTAPPEAEAP